MKRNLISLSFLLVMVSLFVGPLVAVETFQHSHESSVLHDTSSHAETSQSSDQKQLPTKDGHSHVVLKSVSAKFIDRSFLYVQSDRVDTTFAQTFYFAPPPQPRIIVDDTLRPPIVA